MKPKYYLLTFLLLPFFGFNQNYKNISIKVKNKPYNKEVKGIYTIIPQTEKDFEILKYYDENRVKMEDKWIPLLNHKVEKKEGKKFAIPNDSINVNQDFRNNMKFSIENMRGSTAGEYLHFKKGYLSLSEQAFEVLETVEIDTTSSKKYGIIKYNFKNINNEK